MNEERLCHRVDDGHPLVKGPVRVFEGHPRLLRQVPPIGGVHMVATFLAVEVIRPSEAWSIPIANLPIVGFPDADLSTRARVKPVLTGKHIDLIAVNVPIARPAPPRWVGKQLVRSETQTTRSSCLHGLGPYLRHDR